MKDILGQELQIGDTVAYNPPAYKGITLGIIRDFTPKGVRVSIKRHGKQWASGVNETTTVQRPDNVVRVKTCEHIQA
jgi:uncharacterized protein with PhoU and TrkA domain